MICLAKSEGQASTTIGEEEAHVVVGRCVWREHYRGDGTCFQDHVTSVRCPEYA
jgi:hypothetical protein